MKREHKLGRLNLMHVLQGTAMIALYKIGFIDMNVAFEKALATIKGCEEADLAKQTREWFFEEVTKFSCPGAWQFLNAHRAAGHELVLLTSSSPYAGECAREHFNLDAAITSQYEVHDGLFSGKPLLPICYGEGKVHYAKKYASEHQIDLENSFFYTDSNTDLPMLDAVKNPRVVNPDTRLRLLAGLRSWPILEWRSSIASSLEMKLLQELKG